MWGVFLLELCLEVMYFLFVFVFYHRVSGSMVDVLSRGMWVSDLFALYLCELCIKRDVCIVPMQMSGLRSSF